MKAALKLVFIIAINVHIIKIIIQNINHPTRFLPLNTLAQEPLPRTS